MTDAGHHGAEVAAPYPVRDGLLRAGLVAVAYFLSSKVGLAFVVHPEGLAAVWPPSGVALGALLLSAPRFWPVMVLGILTANVTANLTAGNSFAMSVGFGLANSAEPLVAGTLIRWVLGARPTFGTLKDVIMLVGLAAIVGNAATALLGATVPALGFGAPYWDVWRVWWVADAVGTLLLTPVIVTWGHADRAMRSQVIRQRGEALVLLLALAAVAWAVFWTRIDPGSFALPFPYLTFPFLLWAALRFGPPGAATSSVVLASIAVPATTRDLGPFAIAGTSPTAHVLGVQTFIAVAALSALLTAAIVAERKRAEEQVRRGQRYTRSIIDQAHDAFVAMDERGMIIDWNPQAEATFGWRQADALGRNLADAIIPARHRDAHRHGLRRFLTTGHGPVLNRQIEVTALHRDGHEFPVELSIVPLRVEDQHVFHAFLRDIGERKRLEEFRRRTEAEETQRIREANRLKSEFLANMSHELRTPLNAIIGFTELMHDGKVGPVSVHHQEYLADILSSSRHLLQLINDVLDLSKIESGRMEVRPEPVDLVKAVREVTDILRALASTKRIGMGTVVDPGLTEVVTDPAKFKQVLYNYVSNALKFTPDEGRVTIRVRPEGPEHFRLEVEDTGIGIRSENLERLFVEFQQLDASEAKRHPGTGLGLALTKRLVEAQGGTVGVRSRPGQGSVFLAILPRVATTGLASPRTQVAEPGLSEPVGAPAVLVIEDDARDRAWLVETLREAGYAVVTSATGVDAIARCRERPFDAITLDLILPDMSAADVLKAIRTDGLRPDVGVVIVTVVTEQRTTRSFDVADVLVKPVQAAELLDALRRAGAPAPREPRPP